MHDGVGNPEVGSRKSYGGRRGRISSKEAAAVQGTESEVALRFSGTRTGYRVPGYPLGSAPAGETRLGAAVAARQE